MSESENGEGPLLTRLINNYGNKQGEWERVNALHHAASEQAALDRHLYADDSMDHAVDLSYSE